MKCPKCGRDMELGFLQTPRVTTPIIWVSKLLPLSTASWKWDSQTVSADLGIGNNAIPGHICKTCKMIVADYSAKE